jgi:hypothetical protein
MSKSYGKHKTMGICYGSNTEFYLERRKHQRRVNKHRIRNTIANSDIEDFDDNYEAYSIPKNDDWEEPTDGHYKLTAKELREMRKKNREYQRTSPGNPNN